jgi:hypothetical protein
MPLCLIKPFRQLPFHGEDRVQRRHRLLEDHPDLVAANVAHHAAVGLGEVDRLAVLAVEHQLTARDLAAAELHQAHQRERRHRLARPRFSDDADGLARRHLEGDILDPDDGAALGLELHAQVRTRPGRARRRRPAQHHLLAGALDQNPYLSGGTKEVESASLVLEPLAGFDEKGNIYPRLAESIPTVDNGGVAADLTSITWTHEGGPALVRRHAGDLRGRHLHLAILHPSRGRLRAGELFRRRDRHRNAVDDRTFTMSFAEPKPFPYTALVGAESPLIQKAQFADCMGARAPECTDANFGPIGTGPFVVRVPSQ